MLLGQGGGRPKQEHGEKRETCWKTEKGRHKASLSGEGGDSTRKARG
jgi:hypothetical protein